MKFFVYLISFILILALMGLFVLKKPNGQTWISVNDLLPNTSMIDGKIKSFTGKILLAYESFRSAENNKIELGNEVKIYRWKDSNGNWSYSDKPNASVESKQVFLDPKDIVVLPAFEVPTNDDLLQKNNKALPSSLPTSPSKILDVYKDANNVQKLMDDREQNINKAINS